MRHIQKSFIAIPGSKNTSHIASNFKIFDFELTEQEISEIARLDGTKKYYHGSNSLEEQYSHIILKNKLQN